MTLTELDAYHIVSARTNVLGQDEEARNHDASW